MPSVEPRPGRSRAGFWLIYGLTLLLVTILALEGTTRLLGLAPDIDVQFRNFVADPHLPYRPRPGSVNEGRAATGEFEFHYQHNRFGLRDVDRPTTKPESTFRILGLGDSFTYGVGVPFEQTFLYRLERLLNQRSGVARPIEIVKAGLPRFFPLPERILLQEYGLAYAPDLVLVTVLPNDVLDTFLGIDHVTVDESGYLKTREARELGEIGTFLYLHSHFARGLLQRWVAARIREKFDPRPEEIYRPDGFHEKDWRSLEGELSKMIDLARSIGAEIAFLYIPQKALWDDRQAYPAERLSRFLGAQRVPLIDSLPRLREAAGGTRLYYDLDGHCTPAGHEVISRLLLEELVRLRLVP